MAAARTAELLMAQQIPMIAANDERQMLTLPICKLSGNDACASAELSNEQQAWLATASLTLCLADDVFVCHGTPHSDLRYWQDIVTGDFGGNGSLDVRAAAKSEVLARLNTGLYLKASLIVCGLPTYRALSV